MSFVWLKNLITGSKPQVSSKSRSRRERGTLPTHNSHHSTSNSRPYSSRSHKYFSDEMEGSSNDASSTQQASDRTPLLAPQNFQQSTTHTGHGVPVPLPSSSGGSQNHSRASTAYDPESLTFPLSQSPSSNSSHSSGSKKPWYKVDARVISDATIGLSDGLTVPFALTAGLSALGNTKVVIYGGLAELIAGAISMGLGGYLGAKSELASYKATRTQTANLIAYEPHTIRDELCAVFKPYNLPPPTMNDLCDHLAKSPQLVDFFMKFQAQVPEPASNRALTSALTIASGYFFGGLLPLLPYFFVDKIVEALYISIGVMALALFSFGYVKTCVVEGWEGKVKVRAGVGGGVQMMVVGGAAAGAAMGLVYLFNGLSGE